MKKLTDYYAQPSRLVAWKIVDSEAVILDFETGTHFTLNEVASRAWQLADGSRTVSEIVKRLGEEFEADPSEIENDISRLIRDLSGRNLIELSRGPFVQEEK